MRDERTRQMESSGSGTGAEEFFGRFRAAIVILSGGASGSEYGLDQSRVSMGRGPGVDLAFDDSAMSREHAVVEFYGEGFRIRDLGSTNGVTVNGSAVQVCKLKHGDRFDLGEHRFQYVIEERERAGREYAVPEG
jgi:pSer/pThr/pTyr-binding forkhead associated (FHA) protein